MRIGQAKPPVCPLLCTLEPVHAARTAPSLQVENDFIPGDVEIILKTFLGLCT